MTTRTTVLAACLMAVAALTMPRSAQAQCEMCWEDWIFQEFSL